MTLQETCLVLCGILAAILVLFTHGWWRKSVMLKMIFDNEEFENWKDAVFGRPPDEGIKK